MELKFNPIHEYIYHMYSQGNNCNPILLEHFIEDYNIKEYAICDNPEKSIVEVLTGEESTSDLDFLTSEELNFVRYFRSFNNTTYFVFHSSFFTYGTAIQLMEFCQENPLTLYFNDTSWWGKEYTLVIIC